MLSSFSNFLNLRKFSGTIKALDINGIDTLHCVLFKVDFKK